MNHKIEVKSLISGDTRYNLYSAKELFSRNWEEIIEELIECNCEELLESGYSSCDCDEEWGDFEVRVDEELICI